MTKLVNYRPDVPEEYKERLDKVLKRNVEAFRVDGRLGHVDTKVPVNLTPGTEPISLPMYPTSPEKQRVIDEQLKSWFEKEVIEPSISPWGFPCLAVYHNGKPQVCVDYRKLNAETIADEFPIPGQAEILHVLSGAQVLSSFDTLAGFTQLEMKEEHQERTAF